MKINRTRALVVLAGAALSIGGLTVAPELAAASPAEVAIVTYYSDPGFTNEVGQTGRSCTTGATFRWGSTNTAYKAIDYYPCDQAGTGWTACYDLQFSGYDASGSPQYSWTQTTCPWQY